MMKKKIYRLLDANYNRAKEATRVAEDLIRFIWNDRNLTRELKNCRHEITKTLLTFPVKYRVLVQARDTGADVGKHHVVRDQKQIPTLKDTTVINFKRGQESLRVLEELSKAISQKHSDSFKRIRFKLYELEKKAIRKF
ncbi:MAG: thiamine-phosphate pyrophosphorylase [Candidatus Omnitrophica bacterium]|nr:thiamine-phosphate pyrophosphorylase [Candidatus Omnitrophota bacterium]